MAYDFDPNNREFNEEDLYFAMGGVNMSYEAMREMAIKNGLANVKHGGHDNSELSLDELDMVMGGNPYEQSSGRRVR